MDKIKELEILRKENRRQAVQLKHLRNELLLTKLEYEQARYQYFEIYSKLETLVKERTIALEKVSAKMLEKTR